MTSASEPKAALGRYPLWALMAVTAAVGILLALGRLLGDGRDVLGLAMAAPGTPPTEWALVIVLASIALMVSFAARRGSLRTLLRSRESPTWYGATLIFTGGFFSLANFMGANMSHYVFITWNLRWSALPFLMIVAWPMAYGAVASSVTYMTIVSRRPSAYRWRWVVTGLFLMEITATTFGSAIQAVPWADGGRRTMALYSTGIVFALVALAVACAPGDRRKAYLLDLIASLWLSFGSIPSEVILGGTALSDALRRAGPGYWLQPWALSPFWPGHSASSFLQKEVADRFMRLDLPDSTYHRGKYARSLILIVVAFIPTSGWQSPARFRTTSATVRPDESTPDVGSRRSRRFGEIVHEPYRFARDAAHGGDGPDPVGLPARLGLSRPS